MNYMDEATLRRKILKYKAKCRYVEKKLGLMRGGVHGEEDKKQKEKTGTWEDHVNDPYNSDDASEDVAATATAVATRRNPSPVPDTDLAGVDVVGTVPSNYGVLERLEADAASVATASANTAPAPASSRTLDEIREELKRLDTYSRRQDSWHDKEEIEDNRARADELRAEVKKREDTKRREEEEKRKRIEEAKRRGEEARRVAAENETRRAVERARAREGTKIDVVGAFHANVRLPLSSELTGRDVKDMIVSVYRDKRRVDPPVKLKSEELIIKNGDAVIKDEDVIGSPIPQELRVVKRKMIEVRSSSTTFTEMEFNSDTTGEEMKLAINTMLARFRGGPIALPAVDMIIIGDDDKVVPNDGRLGYKSPGDSMPDSITVWRRYVPPTTAVAPEE